MNVIEALNSRYTCRAFETKLVDKEILLKVLEAATKSPSWANTQPWEIFVAGGEVLERLRKSFLENFYNGIPRKPDLPTPTSWPVPNQKRIEELGTTRYNSLGTDYKDQLSREAMTKLNYMFFNASAVIYLCMDQALTQWSIFDLGLISQSIMLAAKEFGLDTAIAVNLVAYPDLIRSELKIPENLSIIIGIAIGYSAETHIINQFRSPRRSLEDAVTLLGF